MKKFLEEFKAFALKGNMMDMAIGVLIGGAFSTLVTSLTDNIINPIIGILFQTDFSDVVLHLPFDINLGIGAFISAVINFIILAFVLFCMLKAMNKLMDLGKHEEEKPAEPKAEDIPDDLDEAFFTGEGEDTEETKENPLWKQLLAVEDKKGIAKALWKFIKRMAKGILPGHLIIKGTFGTGDPVWTGYLLAKSKRIRNGVVLG